MMYSHKIVKNTVCSMLYRVVLLVLQFIARKVFILYLGSELLGLSSLYANLLDLLNLSELGIGVAVQFHLYTPIVNKDNEKIADILQSAKKIYSKIGICILGVGFFLSNFIPYFIKDNSFSNLFIQITFIISVVGTASSYFFIYKRLYLQANEEIYITNIIDTILLIGFIIIKISLVVWTGSYFIYLLLDIIQKVTSNICVGIVFNIKYKHIISSCQKKKNKKELVKDIKNVIPLKLANYVYSSTDSIIISMFIGLTAVNLYSNYIMVFNQVISFAYLLGDAVKVSYGKIMKEVKDKKFLYSILQEYIMLQFFFSSVSAALLFVLVNDFIILWLGKEYLISNLCVVFLTADFFIHSMFQPLSVVYGAAGKFGEDKKITILMACMNIIVSILTVRYMGLVGVILGTLISNYICMVVRVYQIVYGFFEDNVKLFAKMVLKFHFLAFAEIAISVFLYQTFFYTWRQSFLGLLLSGMILGILLLGINCIIYRKTEVFKRLLVRILKLFYHKIK